MKLYDHQKKIVNAKPKRCGLWLGTGSGKTRTALMLASGAVLVIAPKTQAEDRNWQRELANIKDHTKLRSLVVISKETFRRDWAMLPFFNTVIVDEAHTCLGVTPNTRQRKRVTIPKTSQLFEALDEYLKKHNPEQLYLCTATIVKSPMTVWAAYCLLKQIHPADVMSSWYDFRQKYYTQLPMPGRAVFVAKRDSKTKDALAALVRSLGYVGRLEDYFDVPEQTFKTEYVELTAKQKARIKELPLEYPDPIVLIGKKHQVENGVLAGDEFSDPESFENAKIDRLLDYALEFPKMVVFAKYRAQIEQITDRLNKAGFFAFAMTGDTKDRGYVIETMNKRTEGVFVVQAQISAGWELPTYPVMVFASRTYSFVDYQQAIGRIHRANALKKNLYINLVVRGGIDEAVDSSLANKQDFDERIYLNI